MWILTHWLQSSWRCSSCVLRSSPPTNTSDPLTLWLWSMNTPHPLAQTQTNAFKKQNRNCSQGQDIIGIPAESSWACVVVHMFADTFPSFSCLTWFNLKISVKSQNKLHIPDKREKQFWLAKPWRTYATLLQMFSSRIRYNYIMLHTNVGLLVHRTPCIASSTQCLSVDSSSQVLGRTIEHTILQLQTSQPSTYIIGKACEDQ